MDEATTIEFIPSDLSGLFQLGVDHFGLGWIPLTRRGLSEAGKMEFNSNLNKRIKNKKKLLHSFEHWPQVFLAPPPIIFPECLYYMILIHFKTTA